MKKSGDNEVKFEHKNIEDFFRDSFLNYEEKGLEHSWFDIDARVTRNNFYKFSFTNFNIVYLVLIVSTFILTSYLAYDNYTSKRNIIDQERVPVNVQYVYDTIYETKVIRKKINPKQDIKNENNIPITIIEDIINQDSNKSDSVTGTDFSPGEVKQIKVDTVQKIVIIKPEPVVIRDTVTMNAPKNRKDGKKY